VLLLPVGGYYTISADEAVAVWKQLAPKVCIPMHYRTRFDPEMPITPVEDFLKAANAETLTMPLMRAAAGDMSQRPPVVVLEIAEA
jgi:L-ascorbate metabolism protein UlaG (beta-lactamase superfamily)